MAHCLISLGSNLGDSTATLDWAIAQLAQLPATVLEGHSSWHVTAPVGGPAHQREFLNGAALCSTQLSPSTLLAHLREIEALAGRKRKQRWEARTLDLDILLWEPYQDNVSQCDGPSLLIPHPRMVCRPFVLDPAAEVAPWMVHPFAHWSVERLAKNLREGPPYVAIVSQCQTTSRALGKLLDQHCNGRLPEIPRTANMPEKTVMTAVETAVMAEKNAWPRLVLAIAPSATSEVRDALGLVPQPPLLQRTAPIGLSEEGARRMLGLPTSGSVLWIGDPADCAWEEAAAAVDALRGGKPGGLEHWEIWATPPETLATREPT